MLIALWAALAMVCQDLLMTCMVVSEARGRWVMAGLLDSVGWLAQIATIGISVDAIITHGLTPETIVIIAAVTVANFVGTGLGTLLSRRIKAADVIEEHDSHG